MTSQERPVPPSSSRAPARPWGGCSAPCAPSPAPTSAASRSRPRWSGPASRGDQVQYVIMGQVLQAGAGQIPARQAAVKAGIPMNVPALTDQQGLPVRPRRHRAGRPAHPGRRVRHRGGRRPGVDDQRPAPAAQVPRGLQVRRDRDARRDGVRRPDRRLREHRDGRVHREAQHPARHRAAPRRTSSPPSRTSGPPPPRRTASSTPRSPRSRSRSARATRSSSPRTRASAPRPPSSRWPSCAPPSPRTAPSPPAPSSQISDGAAAVVVMSKAKAEELGLEWIAEIGAHGNVAGPDNSLQSQPSNAINARAGQGGPRPSPTST